MTSKATFLGPDESRISKAAKCLPKFGRTVFPIQFVNCRVSSYQAHLETCSDFLLPGPGIWWKREGSEDATRIVNFDGPEDLDQHPQGPQLYHFRNTTISSESENLKEIWHQIIRQGIEIPLDAIRTYDGENLCHVQTRLEEDERREGNEEEEVTGITEGIVEVIQIVPTDVDDDQTTLSCSTNSTSTPLNTSIARLLAKVLGPSDTIKQLDEYHTKAKDAQEKRKRGLYSYWEDKYTTLEDGLKPQVLRRDGEVTKQIQAEKMK